MRWDYIKDSVERKNKGKRKQNIGETENKQ